MYVNGAAVSQDNSAPPIATAPGMDGMVAHSGFTPARIEQIRIQLLDPFDPAEIKWRVTATSSQQSKNGPLKRGQLVAYADQRAYTDRLNEIFGEWGWTRTYNVQVAQNFERVLNKGGNGQKQSVICAKVVVVSTVTVNGLGSHTGVGEEWADDENSATRAEAQAFKRGCACFGLGRYLYDLDKVWEDLDQYNRPVRNPNLPDWAIPAHLRRQPQPQTRQQSAPPAQPRQGLVQQETLAHVKRLCAAVGFGLSKFALQKYGGVTDPSKIGFAKLTTVLDKLTDMAKGVERLRAASAKLGDGRYAAICRELNLASDSLDDVPDRDALCALLNRVESEAGAEKSASVTTIETGKIEVLRGQLLQAARKVAESGRPGWPAKFGDVISQATEGKVTLDQLKNLTDADATVVAAAVARLVS
ncbi:MAG: Rad52/Rad22 family DNA repair protein [Bryobacteraceae bacterium]